MDMEEIIREERKIKEIEEKTHSKDALFICTMHKWKTEYRLDLIDEPVRGGGWSNISAAHNTGRGSVQLSMHVHVSWA